MLAGFIRRAASVGVLASPTQPSSTFDDSADGDDAEEAPLPGGVRAFARDGRALDGHSYALPDRGSDRLPPTGANDRPDTPDSVASDSSGRGASATGLGSAANIPPARFGLALPPSDHAFWRTPDAPQQALSVLASVERERAAAQVAQRALTSAAEFLTKKNAKLKADLTAAKIQLQALNGGAAGGAEAAVASRRASEAEQQQLRQQHASERAVDSQAVVAAQAEVKALRRRVAGLEDALSDSERRHAKALRAAQEAAQASQASGLASASGTPARPGSAPGLVAGGTPQAGVRMPSGFMADDVITAGLRDELADANDRIDELEARLEDAAATARAGADAADAAIAAERAKTQAALAALAAASRGEGGASPSGQVAALRAECEQLRGQAAAAQAKCDQLQRRLRGGDVAVRAERVAAQLEATREAEAQVEALRAELARARAEQTVSSSPASPSAAQAGDVEEQQRVIDALRAELAATQAALARSRSAARSEGPAPSPREVSDLQAAVAAARATADDASRRCAAAEAALRRERATAAEAVSAERTARLAAEATLRRGTNSSAALGAPTAAAFTALKQRLDAAEASLAEVTRERDAALTELSNASLAEVERLQSEIDDDLASSREAQSLRGRLEALTGQLREAQAVAAEAQERAVEAERSLEAHAQASHGESGSSSKAAEEAVSLRAALERERAVSRETEEAMLAEAQAQAQTAAALTSQLEVATAALLDAQAALAREKELRVEAEAAAVEPAPAAPTVPEADLQQLHAAVQACDAQRQQLLRLEAEFTQLHEAFLELSRRLHQAEAAHAELLAEATAREAALQADVTSLAEEAEAAHVHASAVDSRAAEVQAALEETLEQLAMTRQALAEKPPPGAEAAAVMAARESARASERARYEKQVSQRLEAAHAQWQAERTALQKAAAGADALAEEVVRERAAAEEARAEAAALRRKWAQAARDSSDSDADDDDASFADAVDHERGADAGLGNTPDAGAASLAAEEAAALRSALASIASQRATAEVQAAQAAQRASQAEAVILELRQQLDERQEALEALRARHDNLATTTAAEQEAGSASSSPGEDTQAESAVSFLTHEDLDGGQPGDEGAGEPDAALAAFELAAEALQQRMRRACSLPVREWAAATRVM
jgi:hypothetical protein